MTVNSEQLNSNRSLEHRLVWKSHFDDSVSVFTRGNIRVKGPWISDTIGTKLILRSPTELRTYQVKEWTAKLECTARLIEVIDTVNETITEYADTDS